MATFNAGEIEASLTLDRSPFQREVKKTIAEAEKLERKEIEIEATLKKGDFDKKIAALKAEKAKIEADRLVVEADLDKARRWKKSTKDLKAEIARLSARSVEIDVDIDDANKKVGRLKAQLATVRNAQATLKVNSVAAMAKLAAANMQVSKFQGQHHARLNANTAGATAQVGIVNGMLARFRGIHTARLRVAGGGQASRALNSTRMIIMAVLALLPLIPAAAAPAAAALVAVGGALTAGAGAAGALGLGIWGAISAFKAVKDPLKSANRDIRNFAKVLDGVKKVWADWQKATSGAAFQLMTQGLQIVSDNMMRLKPIFDAVVPVMGAALDSIAKFMGGPEGERMFTFFGTVGVQAFESFLNIGGNLLLFFGRLFEAFGPFIGEFLDGLESMTAGWAEWADGLGKTQGFQDFLDWVRVTGPDVIDMFVSLWDALVNIGKALAPLADPWVKGLSAAFDWIADLDPTILGAVIVGIGGATVAFQALSAAIAIVNLVLAANPFVWIAMAVIGLVGAIIYLWKTNEGFRNAIKTAWDAIMKAIQPVIDWIVDIAVPAVVDAFKAFIDRVKLVWNTVSPVFEAIGDIIKRVFGVISWVWTEIGQPIFNAWMETVKFLWTYVVKPVLAFIWEGFKALGAILWWVWKSLIGPVFELFMAIVRKLWDIFVQPVLDKIGKGWDNMATIFKHVWKTHIKPVIEALMGIVRDKLAPVFHSAMDAVGKAWDRLKDLARAPVKFVVDTIINQGLIKGFNKLADIFGTSHIDYLRLPGSFYGYSANAVGGRQTQARGQQALAFGGPVRGSSPTPTADNIPIWATAGEFMQPRHAVDYYGTDIMEAMRRRVIPKEWFQGFASGGLVDFGRMLQGMGYRVGEHPSFGGVQPVHTKNSLHYSGNAIDVNWASGTSAAEQAMLAKIIPLAHAQGLRTIFMAPGHYGHAHIDTGRGGGALASIGSKLAGIGKAVMDAISNPVKFFTDKVNGFIGKIPGGGNFLDIMKSVPRSMLDWFIDKAKGLVGGFGDLATGTADVGGQLLPGYNLLYNGTGENEPILTGPQWRQMSQERDDLIAAVKLLLANGGLGGNQPLVGGDLILKADPSDPVSEQFNTVLFKLRTLKKG